MSFGEDDRKKKKKKYQRSHNQQINFQNVLLNNTAMYQVLVAIVGFFIPVSSLKVLGHSIHSERRRIYQGKSVQALQNDTLSYHDYSVSGSSRQQCSGIPVKLLCLFSSILFHHKNFLSST